MIQFTLTIAEMIAQFSEKGPRSSMNGGGNSSADILKTQMQEADLRAKGDIINRFQGALWLSWGSNTFTWSFTSQTWCSITSSLRPITSTEMAANSFLAPKSANRRHLDFCATYRIKYFKVKNLTTVLILQIFQDIYPRFVTRSWSSCPPEPLSDHSPEEWLAKTRSKLIEEWRIDLLA